LTNPLGVPHDCGVEYTDLLRHYGSQAAIAKAFGIQQPSVAEWKKRGVPEKRQLEAEQNTGGELKAHPRVRNKYKALLGIRRAA
jgi:DNA-binding transcriptional regulator YdaS (Cro superfamily)